MKKVILTKYIVLLTCSFFFIAGTVKSQCPDIYKVRITDMQYCPCNGGNFAVYFTNPSFSNVTVNWNFGDGATGTTSGALTFANLSHSYTSPGNYTVWMYLIGPGTCRDSVSTTFSVTCLSTPGCPTVRSLNYTCLTNNAAGQVIYSETYPCGLYEFTVAPCSNNVLYLAPGPFLLDTIPVLWNFGDGITQVDTITQWNGAIVDHTYLSPGIYTVSATFLGPGACTAYRSQTISISCTTTPCTDCISSFAPIPGKKYLVSGWVKEASPVQSKTSYTFPSITVTYPSISGSDGPYFGSGDIIDGWQRVEGIFTIPSSATDIGIKLDCSSGDCYFDDVRMLPFDGAMKSYVYDPVNLRLVAELDERNYATLYEYDEEGKLLRVKKETEKGIMTIKENRSNLHK